MGTEGRSNFDQKNQCLVKLNLLNLVDLNSYKYLQSAPVLIAGDLIRIHKRNYRFEPDEVSCSDLAVRIITPTGTRCRFAPVILPGAEQEELFWKGSRPDVPSFFVGGSVPGIPFAPRVREVIPPKNSRELWNDSTARSPRMFPSGGILRNSTSYNFNYSRISSCRKMATSP